MARGKFTRGFSLVELMAAAAIMGILVSLALPRYRLFVARSRMAEAKTNLAIIYGLQQSYKAEFEQYGTIDGGMGCAPPPGLCSGASAGQEAKNELGFRVTDCAALRYLYTSISRAGANANSSGQGTCEIYPSCVPAAVDEWKMSDLRKLTHSISVVKTCSD